MPNTHAISLLKKTAKAKNRFNQHRDNVYISVLKMYDEEILYLECNEILNADEINVLLKIEQDCLATYEKFLEFCII